MDTTGNTPQPRVNATRCQLKVCYLAEEVAVSRNLVQPAGTPLRRALQASGIFAQIGGSVEDYTYAIYGKKQPLNALVQNGDRIEILRPVNPDAQKRARTLRNK